MPAPARSKGDFTRERLCCKTLLDKSAPKVPREFFRMLAGAKRASGGSSEHVVSRKSQIIFSKIILRANAKLFLRDVPVAIDFYARVARSGRQEYRTQRACLRRCRNRDR